MTSHGFFVRFCPRDTRGQYVVLSEGFTCSYFKTVLRRNTIIRWSVITADISLT